MEARKSSRRFKVGEISEHDSQIFPRTGRISGPEVADGAKPDVPTTDRRNEKKKQEIFKSFQATTVTNRFNLSLPPSLDSTYKHP